MGCLRASPFEARGVPDTRESLSFELSSEMEWTDRPLPQTERTSTVLFSGGRRPSDSADGRPTGGGGQTEGAQAVSGVERRGGQGGRADLHVPTASALTQGDGTGGAGGGVGFILPESCLLSLRGFKFPKERR